MAKQLLGHNWSHTFVSIKETPAGLASYPAHIAMKPTEHPFIFHVSSLLIACLRAHCREGHDKHREFENTLLKNFLNHPAWVSMWIFVIQLKICNLFIGVFLIPHRKTHFQLQTQLETWFLPPAHLHTCATDTPKNLKSIAMKVSYYESKDQLC